MRVYCKDCHGKARIGTREEVSIEFVKLYCQCLDPRCGATFVMNLSYSHALRPSGAAIDQLLFDRLRELPLSRQRQLFDQLGGLS